MKAKYEKPDLTEQETLEATSGASDMLPYEPFLPFTPSGTLPSTGGDPVKPTSPVGPMAVAFGGLLAAGGALVGWLSRRGARDAAPNEDD